MPRPASGRAPPGKAPKRESRPRAESGDLENSINTGADSIRKPPRQARRSLTERPESRRERVERLCREIVAVGSPRQWRQADKILDQLEEGRRVSQTTAGLAEALWVEALNHGAAVQQLGERPPVGVVRAAFWKHGFLFVDDWPLHQLRQGNPVTRLLAVDAWRA